MKQPLIEVRRSAIHGSGVFALRHIRKGTRIIEYVGERLSHAAADARYDDHDENDNHTFLFVVDRHTVIDAAVDGNEARFINHSCDGNCESAIEDRRVWIDAVRDIVPGEELNYDYEIGREKDDPPNIDEIYACRCGAASCRGTMLWPPRKERTKGRGKQASSAHTLRDNSRQRSASGSRPRRRDRLQAGSKRAGARDRRRGSRARRA